MLEEILAVVDDEFTLTGGHRYKMYKYLASSLMDPGSERARLFYRYRNTRSQFKLAASDKRSSSYHRHQGKKEMARRTKRLAQIATTS